jgi:hypothetical protein
MFSVLITHNPKTKTVNLLISLISAQADYALIYVNNLNINLKIHAIKNKIKIVYLTQNLGIDALHPKMTAAMGQQKLRLYHAWKRFSRKFYRS